MCPHNKHSGGTGFSPALEPSEGVAVATVREIFPTIFATPFKGF